MTYFIGGLGLSSVATRGRVLPQSGIQIPLGTTNLDSFISGFPTGSEFRFLAGTYRLQNIGTLTARTGDIYHGTTSGSTLLTTLSGAQLLTGWTPDGSGHWFVTGVTVENPTGNPASCSTLAGNFDPDYPNCIHPEDLFMDDVVKLHVSTLPEVVPGTWYFDYAANTVYVGDDPTGMVVELSAVQSLYTPLSSAQTVTLADLIVEKFATPQDSGAVNMGYSPFGGYFWVTEGCEVRYNHGSGVACDAETTVRNCYIHHNMRFGLNGAGWNNIVEGNEIAFNNYMKMFNPYDGAGGSKWVFSTDMIIRGNYSHDNWGPGLWTDINNIRILYEDNLVEDNHMAGIFHEISYECEIVNNTLRRNGITSAAFPFYPSDGGIQVYDSRNVEVHGNLLEQNYQEIACLSDARDGTVGIDGPWELTGLNVHGNTVVNTTVPAGGGRSGAETTHPVTQWNNNTYTLGSAIPERWYYNSIGYQQAGWQGIGFDTTSSITFV